MLQGSKPRLAMAALTAVALLAFALPASGQERPNHRIVGGVTTTIEEWPWQVALVETQPFRRQICGGTLIARDLVVSAAHCVHNGFVFDPPGRYEVLSGRTTLSQPGGAFTEVIEINYFTGDEDAPALDSFPAVPLYQPFDDSWDAVVLELDTDVPLPAQPIQIAGPTETATWAPGADAAITGWGSNEEDGLGADTLHEAAIQILPDPACEDAYEPVGVEYDAETMLCAGLEEGGRDTCQGDSGGPLVVPLAGGGFRLVGDTSFGIGCADPEFPGVYGRLADDPMRGAIAAFADDHGEDVIGSGGQPGAFTQSQDPPPDPDPDPDPRPSPRCLVPGLRAKTVPNARRALRARRCRLGTVTRRRASRFRRGRIVAQHPRRGARRAVGFRVRVVVSSGRR